MSKDRNAALQARLDAAARVVEALDVSEREGRSLVSEFALAGGVLLDLGPARGWRARLHGFSATCTGGPQGAVHNWRWQVLIKSGEKR